MTASSNRGQQPATDGRRIPMGDVVRDAPNGSPWGSLRARERERVAVALRVEGYTYAEIGDRLGVSDRMASRIVNRAMNRVLREPVGQLIDLESARLDALWAAMWPRALAGSARHAEVCVRISERRSRLLGLDQPTRVDANLLANVTVDQIDAEIERLLAEYGERGGGS
jgi:DNA-binding CsgD family transcriptional regulator